MVQILRIPEYRLELLTGLIASAGGLTESLVVLFRSRTKKLIIELMCLVLR